MYLKVCGMKHNTAEVALLEPDFLGFIFWEPSKRYFQGELPPLTGSTKKVGVFVDAPLEEVVQTVIKYNLHLVQLHGSEGPQYCSDLQNALWASDADAVPEIRSKTVVDDQNELQGRPQLMKVFPVGEDFDFSVLDTYEDYCDLFMFDTKGKLPGGNGYAFDWELLKNYPSEKPFFLSGGIGPEDIDKLIDFINSDASLHCFAIDINSKFELSPGHKDTERIRKFIQEFNRNCER